MARFLYQRDKQNVLSNTYRLNGKPFGAIQQYPDVVEQARDGLYPIMKEKREQGYRL